MALASNIQLGLKCRSCQSGYTIHIENGSVETDADIGKVNYSLRLNFNRGGHYRNSKETRFET